MSAAAVVSRAVGLTIAALQLALVVDLLIAVPVRRGVETREFYTTLDPGTAGVLFANVAFWLTVTWLTAWWSSRQLRDSSRVGSRLRFAILVSFALAACGLLSSGPAAIVSRALGSTKSEVGYWEIGGPVFVLGALAALAAIALLGWLWLTLLARSARR